MPQTYVTLLFSLQIMTAKPVSETSYNAFVSHSTVINTVEQTISFTFSFDHHYLAVLRHQPRLLAGHPGKQAFNFLFRLP